MSKNELVTLNVGYTTKNSKNEVRQLIWDGPKQKTKTHDEGLKEYILKLVPNQIFILFKDAESTTLYNQINEQRKTRLIKPFVQ